MSAMVGDTRNRSEGLPASGNPRAIVWLMSLRVVVVTTLMLSALLVQAITSSIFAELNPIYYMVGFTYVLTIVYAAIYAAVRWARWFVYLQLLGDLLLITGLIYYSGGLDSAFPFLYILTVITASILLMRRGGLLIALVACVLYGSLVALIYLKLLPPTQGFLATPATLTMNQVYYNLFVRWIGFVAAALLSSYLAEKLRETGETLEARSAEMEKLQVFYEDVIGSLNSGLLTADRAGRIVTLNQAGEAILGVRLEEARGRMVEEVLGFDEQTGDWPQRVGAEGLRVEHWYRTPTGVRRDLDIWVSRFYDRANVLRGYTGVFQDLTKLKELEREVRLKERMAAVGELAAAMAHEIRNPLASMSGSIQMLRSDLPLDSEQAMLMEIVLRESARLNRTIEEFLFYSKPVAPIPQDVDLGALAADTATLFRNSSELRPGHQILCQCDGSGFVVRGDPGQLRQVLLNLLRNAAQAMPEGGVIELRVGPPDSEGVALRVLDQGPGFGEAARTGWWEPFHRSTTKGLGLGLAIVYQIVREHRGRVQLGGRQGGGAEVSIWLPRAGPLLNEEHEGDAALLPEEVS